MAVLGCAHIYTAIVYWRGGRRVLGTLENLSSVHWDRKLNEVGEATIVVGRGTLSRDCCILISQIQTWQHELHLYRDGERVWQGPITDVSETRQTQDGQNTHMVTIAARDVTKYLDVRVNPHGFTFTGDAALLAEQLAADACTLDDPQLMRMITSIETGTTVNISAAAQSVYVLAEWRNLGNIGLYWTTVDRAIYLFGLSSPPFPGVINLSADDLAAAVTVQQNGQLYANVIYAHGSYSGTQTLPNVVPMSDPWQVTLGHPEATVNRGYVEALIDATSAQMQSEVSAAAQQGLVNAGAYQLLRVADNSQINPQANVTVDQLICGAQVNLARHPEFCTWANSTMQLSRVICDFASEGEKIGISLVQMPPIVPSPSTEA